MDLNSSMTIIEALNRASIFLEENGLDGSLSRYYWLKYFDWTLTDYVKHLHDILSLHQIEAFEKVIKRIVNNEPIQYICGYEDFGDMRFKVTKDTLIPREETMGLIVKAQTICEKNPKLKILDIGTGTGIIAITLAKLFPQAEIWASDISVAALKVAKENATIHDTEIHFVESDGWDSIKETDFDLVISNPPYISKNEINLMDQSVIKFEPETALFAEEEGLDIYRKILKGCQDFMLDDGVILFEIGFNQAADMERVIEEELGVLHWTISQDLNNLNRYVSIYLGEGESSGN